MKKLGFIGGTGPKSTLQHYRKFVYEANRQIGGDFFPHLSIESINVYQVLEMCRLSDFTRLTALLANAVEIL